MRLAPALLAVLLASGCAGKGWFGGGGKSALPPPAAAPADEAADLTGAWRSSVRFSSGPFVAMGGLEFMYVFNAGGTMTESSNYDAAPPVPPAYGVWKRTGANTYRATYEFFSTAAPKRLEQILRGGGWNPTGRGVLTEDITLSEDGKSFTSTIAYQGYDGAGKPTADKGEAEAQGRRIE